MLDSSRMARQALALGRLLTGSLENQTDVEYVTSLIIPKQVAESLQSPTY